MCLVEIVWFWNVLHCCWWWNAPLRAHILFRVQTCRHIFQGSYINATKAICSKCKDSIRHIKTAKWENIWLPDWLVYNMVENSRWRHRRHELSCQRSCVCGTNGRNGKWPPSFDTYFCSCSLWEIITKTKSPLTWSLLKREKFQVFVFSKSRNWPHFFSFWPI